jgi:hypothetical protein
VNELRLDECKNNTRPLNSNTQNTYKSIKLKCNRIKHSLQLVLPVPETGY